MIHKTLFASNIRLVLFLFLLVLLFKRERIHHDTFCGLIHFFCGVYCTSLHVLFIELALVLNIWLYLVQVFSFCWLVLPFKERNDFIRLS